MNFINREKEMETLGREYKKENSFVVIYGRRRVGKTTLIKEFIKDKKHSIFLLINKMKICKLKDLKIR